MSQILAAKLAEASFSGLSDQAAADAINAIRVTVRRRVPTATVRRTAAMAGEWAALLAAAGSPDAAVRGLAENVLALVRDESGQIADIDLDDPAAVTMLAALVSRGIMSQKLADKIVALGSATIPWTESVGLGEVGIGMVRNARRL